MDDPTGEQPGNQPPPGEQEPGWAKALRKQNEQLQQQLSAKDADIAAMQKASLFSKIGVPETGTGLLFRESYKGEVTEEAIRAEATKYDLVQAPRTTPVEEREVLERIEDQLAGAKSGDDVAIPASVVKAIEEAKDADEIDAILERHNLAAT